MISYKLPLTERCENFWRLYKIRKTRKNSESRIRNISRISEDVLQKEFPNTTDMSYQRELSCPTTEPKSKYNFKNLVLAGGGAKGVAYVGVAKALEERDILNGIQKFAGNNTGSIVAALLCVGFSSEEVEEFMLNNLKFLYIDTWHKRMIPNSEVWHPSEKFMNKMRDAFTSKEVKPNITFGEVYRDYKKELCITAPKEKPMELETYDWKTSSEKPILEAIGKSIYIPAKLEEVKSGKNFQYADGGFLCNYPIYCFDGETLGCLTYTDMTNLNLPFETILSSEWKSLEKRKENLAREYDTCTQGESNFLNIFVSGGQKEFSFAEFKTKFENEIPKEGDEKNNKYPARLYAEMMYGLDFNETMIYEDMKKSGTSQLTANDLYDYDERKKYLLKKNCDALIDKPKKEDENNFNASNKTTFLKQRDVAARTICINTGYICASDLRMKHPDESFLIEQGKSATIMFLKTSGTRP